MSESLNVIVEADMDELSVQLNGRKDPFLRPVDTAAILKTFLWKEFELSRMAAGWMPAAVSYENKVKLARLAYLHTANMRCLHERIKELPGSLNETKGGPESIRAKYELLSVAPHEAAFLLSYHFLLLRLYAEYDEVLSRLDPILDAPTIDQLGRVLLNRHENLRWLAGEIQDAYMDGGITAMLNEWKAYIAQVWNGEAGEWPSRWGDAAGPLPDVSSMDPRFAPANPEKGSALYADPDNSPVHHSIKQMIYVNATEIIAAENLAYLYYSIDKMPLQFYYDLARHMWDEARHSQMGLRRLQQLGFRIEDFTFFPPISLSSDSRIEQLIDGYISLTNVAEACSFPYKRQAAQSFWKFDDALSAIQSEYDIADERLHVDFGTQWGPELYRQIHNEVITAKKLAEKAREFRLKRMNFSPEHIAETAKSFPAFCGVANTVRLDFEQYD